jgi:hypothetical protein
MRITPSNITVTVLLGSTHRQPKLPSSAMAEASAVLRETGDMVVDSDEPTNKKIYM